MNKRLLALGTFAALLVLLAVACKGNGTVGISSADNVLNKVYDSTTTALRANITGTALITSPVANPVYARLVSGSDITGTVIVTSTTSNPIYARLVSGSDVTGTVIITSTAGAPAWVRLASGSNVTGQVGITNTSTGALWTIPVSTASWNVTGTVGVTASATNSLYITGTTRITSTVANPIYARLVSGSDVTGTVVVTNAIGNPIYAVLGTGSNAIGKLAANSGVDIGDVDVTSISAGANIIGKVGVDQTTHGTTNLVSVELITRTQQNPLITAGAYSAGDAVGNILTFTNASRTVGLGGTILSLILQDSDKESAGLELWLFDATFTQTADNGAFDVPDASIPYCIGVIPIAAVDYNTQNDWGVATVRNVNLPYSTIAGTSIYGQLKATGTPTFGNTRDLTVTLVMRWN